ncbi:hypothetical protein KY308_02000 [Candidatus Woesearchaeota archaeon]|nr:hypothetical protein [Candidatus Woesearchaeota archaeon]
MAIPRFKPRRVQSTGTKIFLIVIVGIIIGLATAYLADIYLALNPYKDFVIGIISAVLTGLLVAIFTRKRMSIYY